MPTIISHAVVAAAGVTAFAPRAVPPHFWRLAVLSSVLPDGDVLAFSLGIPYHHFFGHRGFFHSPFFALLWSLAVVLLLFREGGSLSKRSLFTFLFFLLLTASHGLLDALTDGGLGIALLSPFTNERFFFPWTPIVVSPIGIRGFFSRWGLEVLASELVWVWLPSILMVVGVRLLRDGRRG